MPNTADLYKRTDFEVYTPPVEKNASLWKIAKTIGLVCWAGIGLGMGVAIGRGIIYWVTLPH